MNSDITAVVYASSPGALVRLCGISMLERLLRILQRIGVSSAIILNPSAEVRSELARPSWPRDKIHVEFATELPQKPGPFLFVSADTYCESRILAALVKRSVPTVAIDSEPPTEGRSLWNEAPRFRDELACGPRLAYSTNFEESDFAILDVAKLPSYIGSIRRTIHPLWFPPPSPQNIQLAENLILDSATKGTPDIPSIFQRPVETWLTRQICFTKISPNQITLFTTLLGVLITIQFSRGQLWSGLFMAIGFGILDGVDGKLARVKVETTEVGKWEHYIDHALEYSWWLALAWSLGNSSQLQHAWFFGCLVIGGDLLGKIVTRPVKVHTGKPSHDFSRFEQRLRLVGGRRDIYIGILLLGLIAGIPALAFVVMGCWSMITALTQTVRSIYICYFTPRLV